jgi:hypothetical protein
MKSMKKETKSNKNNLRGKTNNNNSMVFYLITIKPRTSYAESKLVKTKTFCFFSKMEFKTL